MKVLRNAAQRLALGPEEPAFGDALANPLDDLTDFTAQDAKGAISRTKQLTNHAMNVTQVGKMMKRRLREASLPSDLSPHSFRVTTITDLLDQGVPLEDVQRLAGHADPRTTRLYDRRQKKITSNIVERISI
jgi:site-specific recombinase XerD